MDARVRQGARIFPGAPFAIYSLVFPPLPLDPSEAGRRIENYPEHLRPRLPAKKPQKGAEMLRDIEGRTPGFGLAGR
jgi:hypothetical protein